MLLFCDWRMNSNEPCVRTHTLIHIRIRNRSGKAVFCFICSDYYYSLKHLIARIDLRANEWVFVLIRLSSIFMVFWVYARAHTHIYICLQAEWNEI